MTNNEENLNKILWNENSFNFKHSNWNMSKIIKSTSKLGKD